MWICHRKEIAMKLVQRMYRLYDLLETQIEGKRHYVRAPFSEDLSDVFEEPIDFNRDVDADDLDEMLDDLTDAIYGEDIYGDDSDGFCFEISEDLYDCDRAIFRVKYDGESLEFSDILDRIADSPKHSRLFILVAEDLTEYKWVVAVPKSTVYFGLTSLATWFRRCFVERGSCSESVEQVVEIHKK
jgi:hypothetical protein